MNQELITHCESTCKSVDRGAGRLLGPLERFANIASGGAVLMMTARFGRSPVREAAYRLCARRPDLDLKPSWRMFASLDDWGNRWTAEKHIFAAGLILSAAGDPVLERAVGRCLADLAQLGRPLLWGVGSDRLRWHPRFIVSPNGWAPEEVLRHPASYARLRPARQIAEFCPKFDPILFSADIDFVIIGSRLRWREARHFAVMACNG
jgi:hypothetical protein